MSLINQSKRIFKQTWKRKIKKNERTINRRKSENIIWKGRTKKWGNVIHSRLGLEPLASSGVRLRMRTSVGSQSWIVCVSASPSAPWASSCFTAAIHPSGCQAMRQSPGRPCCYSSSWRHSRPWTSGEPGSLCLSIRVVCSPLSLYMRPCTLGSPSWILWCVLVSSPPTTSWS